MYLCVFFLEALILFPLFDSTHNREFEQVHLICVIDVSFLWLTSTRNINLNLLMFYTFKKVYKI